MNTCDDTLTDLDAFRDGELEVERCRAVGEHLAHCDSCRQKVARDNAFEQQLRSAADDWTASDELWQRIRKSSRRSQPAKGPRLPLPAIAAGLLLALGAVVSLLSLERHQPQSGDRVATALVNEFHTFVVSQRDLDFSDDRPQQIRNWFGSKVDFRVPLPVRTREFRLAGGRLCNMLDQRIVSYMYRIDDAWVSLYIMKSTDKATNRQPGLEQILRGYGTINWQADGLVYTLVGDVDSNRLREIARALYMPQSAESEPVPAVRDRIAVYPDTVADPLAFTG